MVWLILYKTSLTLFNVKYDIYFFSETFKKLEKGAALLEKELIDTKTSYEDSLEKVKSLENTLQNTFKYQNLIKFFYNKKIQI